MIETVWSQSFAFTDTCRENVELKELTEGNGIFGSYKDRTKPITTEDLADPDQKEDLKDLFQRIEDMQAKIGDPKIYGCGRPNYNHSRLLCAWCFRGFHCNSTHFKKHLVNKCCYIHPEVRSKYEAKTISSPFNERKKRKCTTSLLSSNKYCNNVDIARKKSKNKQATNSQSTSHGVDKARKKSKNKQATISQSTSNGVDIARKKSNSTSDGVQNIEELDKQEMDSINHDLAMFLLTSGIPLRHAKNEWLISAIYKLNSTFENNIRSYYLSEEEKVTSSLTI